MLIGVGIHRFSWLKRFEVEAAKIYHFEHNMYGIFKRDLSARKEELASQ